MLHLALLDLALLALIAAAAGLEGAVVPGVGGPIVAVGAVLAGYVVWREGAAGPPRLVLLAAALLALSALWHLLPLPPTVVSALAPGLAPWRDLAAPEWPGDLYGWLDTLHREDLYAAVDLPPEAAADPLHGSVATAWRVGAVGGERAWWAAAQLLGLVSFTLLGRAIGRDERLVTRFGAGLVLLGVAEALFGIANRNGPSTGIGPKLYYLGSATGTFINRGHYGAFLVLALAAAWGLAAGLFPLEHEEVARHRRHRLRSSQPPSLLVAAGDRIPRLGLLALGAGGIGVAIVASQSRGPILGFGVAAAVVGLWAWRRRGEVFHLGIGVGLPLVCGALSVLGFGLRGAFGRFASLLDTGDTSLTSRLGVWREGLLAFAESPWLGGGVGSWRLVRGLHETSAHLYDFQHAHNEVIERLAEQGVVGAGACLLLLIAWGRPVLRGFLCTGHDPRTAMGVAALVGVGAVLLQSMGDFPLWTPGVALPTAVMAGIAYGALTEPDVPGVGVSRWATLLLGPVLALAGVTTAAAATLLDRAVEGTREERVGEIPAVWRSSRLPPPDAASARVRAAAVRAAVAATPLDPWAQLALARAEVACARYAARGEAYATGASLESHQYAADLALTRALRLRPLDPHVQLAVAREQLLLARTGSAADAWRRRAVDHLVEAVRLDPWRAADAFRLAEEQPRSGGGRSGPAQGGTGTAEGALFDTLARIAAAGPPSGAPAARVWYAYGQALDRARDTDGALGAYSRAAAADPAFGPPLFQRGVLLRAAGDDAGATTAFRAFLDARERPAGMEGWALIHLGDLDDAGVKLRRVVTDNPDNRWAWEGLAEVARQEADPSAELLAWRHVLALSPGDARARERVRTLEAGAQ